MSKPFYITTTLPYVNADLHVGHAMEFIRADVIARWHMLQGDQVFFNTGTDEHGSKIWQRAQKAGANPQEYVDTYAEKFKDLIKILGMSDSIHIIRTTDAHHEAAAQEFWRRCDTAGYIYKKAYKIKYCVGCELEKTDSELDEKGECPLHPDRPLELIDEENYFFKFSEFQKPLLEFYNKNPNFVTPDFRFNEIKVFVERGLEDFSISRLASKMPWGVPVPGDAEQVMYVWFDALVNYVSTLGWPEDTVSFEKFWVSGTPTQYCGKDNLRQQSAMWQSMLMAAGLPNSHQIVINGFYTGEGGVKMSKSIGNVINPYDIVEEYGVDALRYFVTRETASFEDSPFTLERFKDAYNAGLANGLGNLVSRVMKMVVSYDVDISQVSVENICLHRDIFDEALNQFKIKDAMDYIWDCISTTNSMIQKEEPFKKIRIDEVKAKEDIKQLTQQLFDINKMLEPVLPETAETISKLIRNKQVPDKPLFVRKD